MKLADVSTFMGYGIAGMMGIVGVLVLSGVLAKEGTAAEFRMLFGTVLIMYSVYRFMMTRMRYKQKQDERSEE